MQESGMHDAAILQSEEVLGPVSETAAQELVTAHLLLAEDVSLCRSIAADRYDAIMDG